MGRGGPLVTKKEYEACLSQPIKKPEIERENQTDVFHRGRPCRGENGCQETKRDRTDGTKKKTNSSPYLQVTEKREQNEQRGVTILLSRG